MNELEGSEIDSISGGVVPLVVYFVWGVYIGAAGTSVGMYWASTSQK